jgi:hypothetical protein
LGGRLQTLHSCHSPPAVNSVNTKIRFLPSIITSLTLALAACAPVVPQPTAAVPALLTPAPSKTPTATQTATPTPQPTPTLSPGAPCGRETSDSLFVFLDCNDVLRIRSEIYGNPATSREWRGLLQGVNDFVANPPITYSPNRDESWLWLDFMPRDIALVYLVTGDTQYASAILHILDIVVDGTPQTTPESGQPQSGLAVPPGVFTSSYISLLFAYTTIRGALPLLGYPSSDYDAYFMEQATRLDAWSSWVASLPNDIWNQFLEADAAIATIALTFPDDPQSQALYSRARQRLHERIAVWYDTDGGWREYADNYSPYVIQALLLYAESELARGVNIYSTTFGHANLHSICQWYLRVMTPEGVLPAIGDGHWVQSLDPGILRLCATRTDDPTLHFAFERYLYGRARFPSRDYRLTYLFDTIAWSQPETDVAEPDWTSTLLADSGLAVLRSGWSPESQYMLLEFAEDGLSHPLHQHQSFGNIVLYDGGAWMLENGYRGRTDEEYWSAVSTPHHSTLTLDGASQTDMRATRTFFAAPGEVAMVSATAHTYPALSHTRTVLWSEPWHQWVVIDDAALYPPSAGHSLQLRWYVSIPDSRHPLHVDHSDQPDPDTWVFTRTWGTPGTLSINLLPALPASYAPIERLYIDPWEGRASGVEIEVAPMTWPVRLVSVLTSTLTGNAPVSSVLRTDAPTGTLVSTLRSDAQWDWVLPRASSTHADIGPFLVNGHAACLESSGTDVASYCLLGGTTLSYAGVALVSSATPLSANVRIADSLVHVDAPADLVVRLFWPTEVVEVTDDLGRPVEFTLSGNALSLHAEEGGHTYSVLALAGE